MSSQAFLYLNLGVGLLVLLFFMIGKRGVVAPSKLKLSASQKADQAKNKKSPTIRSREVDSAVDFSEPTESFKNLNVMFMYNGHTFDAFEVLGAPAGASLEMVEKFYNQCLARKSSDRDFIQAAYEAIRSDRR